MGQDVTLDSATIGYCVPQDDECYPALAFGPSCFGAALSCALELDSFFCAVRSTCLSLLPFPWAGSHVHITRTAVLSVSLNVPTSLEAYM